MTKTVLLYGDGGWYKHRALRASIGQVFGQSLASRTVIGQFLHGLVLFMIVATTIKCWVGEDDERWLSEKVPQMAVSKQFLQYTGHTFLVLTEWRILWKQTQLATKVLRVGLEMWQGQQVAFQTSRSLREQNT